MPFWSPPYFNDRKGNSVAAHFITALHDTVFLHSLDVLHCNCGSLYVTRTPSFKVYFLADLLRLCVCGFGLVGGLAYKRELVEIDIIISCNPLYCHCALSVQPQWLSNMWLSYKTAVLTWCVCFISIDSGWFRPNRYHSSHYSVIVL